MCMKMQYYFWLNIKHGASQLYFGPKYNCEAPGRGGASERPPEASNSLAPALVSAKQLHLCNGALLFLWPTQCSIMLTKTLKTGLNAKGGRAAMEQIPSLYYKTYFYSFMDWMKHNVTGMQILQKNKHLFASLSCKIGKCDARIFVGDNDSVCLTECGTWTIQEGRASLGGMEHPYSSLSDCLNKCLEMSGCVAVDVSVVVCFVHTHNNDRDFDSFPSSGFMQYKLQDLACHSTTALTSQTSTQSTYFGKWHYMYRKPNTHRRRRRGATVELSRVGGMYVIRNLLATVLTSLNKFCQQRVELHPIGAVNAPVASRRELVAIVFTLPMPTRLNSTVVSRRRRRCVLGIKNLCCNSSYKFI